MCVWSLPFSNSQWDWSLESTALQLLLADALTNLDRTLWDRFRNRLLIQSGPSTVELLRAVMEAAASGQALGSRAVPNQDSAPQARLKLYYNRHYEPWERDREAAVVRHCRSAGVECHGYEAFLFREPENCPIFQAVKGGRHIFKAFWEGWHKGGPIRSEVPHPDPCAEARPVLREFLCIKDRPEGPL